MTADQERKIQLRVGVFVLLGLILIASMVTYFGRLGEGFQQFYSLRVEYPNASGLLRGADVLMAGAKVGKVDAGPFIAPTGTGVYVDLKIYQDVEIPSDSVFSIGSSGLLGDRFVDITMLPTAERAVALQPGSVIEGERESGFDELASEGGLMLAEIRETVATIQTVVSRINEELLTKKTMEGVGKSIGNLQATTETLAGSAKKLDGLLTETSEKIDQLVANVDGVVTESKTILASAAGAVEEGKKAMTSAAGAARQIEATAGDLRSMVRETRQGKGLVGLLLTDQELANNFRALIANLRSHGILFYRDRADEQRR